MSQPRSSVGSVSAAEQGRQDGTYSEACTSGNQERKLRSRRAIPRTGRARRQLSHRGLRRVAGDRRSGHELGRLAYSRLFAYSRSLSYDGRFAYHRRL
ncbi:MAG TPA: hypothetical protein VFK68_08135, partial [Propionibacteriaceae bacterium]|nr:hypothetical protein [Propionibacteriaceae bacterium]